MKTFLRRYGDLVLTAALVVFFLGWPRLDLKIAALFYQPGIGFPMQQLGWIRVLYYFVKYFWIIALILILLLVASFIPALRTRWEPRRKAVGYLLAVLLIGPGLIVHTGMKSHSGRARPIQIVDFGGKAHFTPVLVPAVECKRNCSFVSGHAAAGFYPMAGFWVTRRLRWLVGGCLFGLLVGYARMAVGAHFLSDILFSGVVVYFTCRGLAWLFRLSGAGQGAADDARASSAVPTMTNNESGGARH